MCIAYPEQLVEGILAFQPALDLSHDGLLQLVRAAYVVSMQPEEGRFPNFSVFVPRVGFLQAPSLCVEYDQPTEVDRSSLQRLALSIPQRPYALLVRGADGPPLAFGVVRHEVAGLNTDPAGGFSGALLRGVLLSIVGPGQLLAVVATGDDRFGFLLLNRGEVVYALRATDAPVVHGLASAVGARVGVPQALVTTAIALILGHAEALHHGGAFVFLADDCGSPDELLEAGQATARPAFDAVLRAVAGQAELTARQLAVQNMFDTARCVAQLSAVDGCVVFDARFRCRSFGVEIRIPDTDSLPEFLRVPLLPGQVADTVDLRRKGTRHRSAARFVARRPGSTAFVLSQDGGIRAFHHHPSGQLQAYGPLRVLQGDTVPL